MVGGACVGGCALWGCAWQGCVCDRDGMHGRGCAWKEKWPLQQTVHIPL